MLRLQSYWKCKSHIDKIGSQYSKNKWCIGLNSIHKYVKHCQDRVQENRKNIPLKRHRKNTRKGKDRGKMQDSQIVPGVHYSATRGGRFKGWSTWAAKDMAALCKKLKKEKADYLKFRVGTKITWRGWVGGSSSGLRWALGCGRHQSSRDLVSIK